MQVVASTWYESRRLADELKVRWAKRGLLWADPVASAPVVFTVGREQTAAACR